MLLALLVSGCQGEEAQSPSPVASGSESATPTPKPSSPSPDPKPSPSPTPSPSSEEELLTAEAIAALEEYVALVNQIENAGGEGWEALYPWWGTPEMVESSAAYFAAVLESGMYTEGSTTIVAYRSLALVPDPTGAGLEQLNVEYCLDVRPSVLHRADGTVDEAPAPEPFVARAQLQHLGQGGRWTINSHDSDVSLPCSG